MSRAVLIAAAALIAAAVFYMAKRPSRSEDAPVANGRGGLETPVKDRATPLPAGSRLLGTATMRRDVKTPGAATSGATS